MQSSTLQRVYLFYVEVTQVDFFDHWCSPTYDSRIDVDTRCCRRRRDLRSRKTIDPVPMNEIRHMSLQLVDMQLAPLSLFQSLTSPKRNRCLPSSAAALTRAVRKTQARVVVA